MVDHCKIEYLDETAPIDHGLVRINGETVQIARYETETITLDDGSEVQEDTGRTIAVENIEGAEIKEGNKGKFTVTGFARSRRHTPDEEKPFSVVVIPDPRRCTTCG